MNDHSQFFISEGTGGLCQSGKAIKIVETGYGFPEFIINTRFQDNLEIQCNHGC
jgi:hypothetical protein